MPALELMDLVQAAQLWEAIGADSGYGVRIVAASPCELRVRWIDTHSELLQPTRSVVDHDATVVLPRDVRIGSILWLGERWQLPASGPINGLMEVVAVDKQNDLKGRTTRYCAKCKKFGSTLPLS